MSKSSTTAKTDTPQDEPVFQTDKKGTESNPYAAELQSIDGLTGTVLYATDAPDGTEFEAHIDGSVQTAKAKAGELWIHLDRILSDDPIVYLN